MWKLRKARGDVRVVVLSPKMFTTGVSFSCLHAVRFAVVTSAPPVVPPSGILSLTPFELDGRRAPLFTSPRFRTVKRGPHGSSRGGYEDLRVLLAFVDAEFICLAFAGPHHANRALMVIVIGKYMR